MFVLCCGGHAYVVWVSVGHSYVQGGDVHPYAQGGGIHSYVQGVGLCV